jgi:hypothetical protein
MRFQHIRFLSIGLFLGAIAAPVSAQVPVANGLPAVPIPPASRAIPATSRVSQQRARNYASPVMLYGGRSSVIDFSATGEVITYIQLSDLSQIVYDTNAPLDSGAARTIVLRPIQPLAIEGTLPAVVPNLVVTTVDGAGESHTYLFDLYHHPDSVPDRSESSGIAIVPAADLRAVQLTNNSAQRPNVLQTAAGEATLADLERGLAIALEAGYTTAEDPVVFAVREAIALARNGTPLRSAAAQLQLDLAVLTSLGELGIAERLQREIVPDEAAGAAEAAP